MTRRSRRALAWALAVISLLAAGPAAAQTAGPGKPDFDSRSGQPVRPAAPTDPAGIAARDRLNSQLGRQGILDVDDRTGTPRMIARLDGFLTGPSDDDPAAIVLEYVRAQRGVFGLTEEDLDALRLVKRYTDTDGITHLLWAQTWRGIAAWDNDLRAAVTADGRLINVGGSPVPDLATRTDDPELNASQALSAALGDVGRRGLAPRATPRGGADRRTTFSGGHSARLVLFTERRGDVHLAWSVVDDARPGEIYQHLIDARSGDVLARHNRVDALTGQVDAFEYAPGETNGGTQGPRDVPIDAAGDDLKGPNAWAYPDLDGDNDPDSVPGTRPTTGLTWTDPFVDECPSAPICSWGSGVDDNDKRQGAAQAYYFVNAFHDWLALPDVGFTGFEGIDAVRTEVLAGFDDGERNNAWMYTPPEGQAPTMAMFMWNNDEPGRNGPNRNGADDATVVFHEYTHGLSNRLVINASGWGALGHAQAGAMGEGWSDWYAMDYLVENGLEGDSDAPGEIAVGAYSTGLPTGVRSAGADCPVASVDANCDEDRDTYDDFVGNSVHADGEIWGQTLWELRTALGGNGPGAQKARAMITEAMRLSPPEPSYLDMRNAILLADQAQNAGANRATIWSVFAARGMGFAASSSGGDDKTPSESFAPAPPPGGGIAVTGRVTDAATGAPIAGALVEFPDVPGDASDRTDTNGNYSIAGMTPGTYDQFAVSAPGREIVVRRVAVSATASRVDQRLRRNLAAASGGATAVNWSNPAYGGCDPKLLIDGARGTGWGTDAGGEKHVTIRLPAAADVAAFRVDPGAICGDDDSASTGAYRIETSTDGTTFTTAASGTFTADDNHRLNELPVDRRGVRYVKFVARAPQSRAVGTSGELYLDAAELEVMGPRPVAAAAPPALKPAPADPVAPAPGPTLDLTAPVARLALTSRQRIKTALRRGLRLRVTCDEACSGTFIATIDAKTAKRVGLLKHSSRRKSLKIASGRIALAAGQRTVTLKFSRKAKARLKRQKRLKLGVVGTVSDAPGNARRVRKTLALRR